MSSASLLKCFTKSLKLKSGKQIIAVVAKVSNNSSIALLQSQRGSVSVLASRTFANSVTSTYDAHELSDEACPQGVQGYDGCDTFKLWADNCRRYGLQNCEDQLQGIQSGRKTLSEVLHEQDQLIADIASEYRAVQNERHHSAQGIQEEYSAFPTIDSPCPQGIQGDDCARFKLWLENCHRFGIQDCMHQYTNFKAGRKTLAQIFKEQDEDIRQAATLVQQRRSFSTSARQLRADQSSDPTTESTKPPEGQKEQLTQRQRLQRAVKEYGSTVIVFHVSISLMSLGFFYVLVSSGIDVVGMLQKMRIGETILQNKLAAGTGTFVVAYAVHKVFAPARIATTLTATPFIVRYLRRIGFLKVPKT